MHLTASTAISLGFSENSCLEVFSKLSFRETTPAASPQSPSIKSGPQVRLTQYTSVRPLQVIWESHWRCPVSSQGKTEDVWGQLTVQCGWEGSGGQSQQEVVSKLESLWDWISGTGDARHRHKGQRDVRGITSRSQPGVAALHMEGWLWGGTSWLPWTLAGMRLPPRAGKPVVHGSVRLLKDPYGVDNEDHHGVRVRVRV